jgi:hypothetical protein
MAPHTRFLTVPCVRAGTAEPSDAVRVVKRKRRGQRAAKQVPCDERALEPERADRIRNRL